MSTLLNKNHRFYQVKLVTREEGVKKVKKYVNVVFERPLNISILAEFKIENFIVHVYIETLCQCEFVALMKYDNY